MTPLSAEDVIRMLGLPSHPERRYYLETFRDPRCDDGGRSVSTAIYFLLKEGEISRWHRVDAAEVWHWYAGAPLELSVAPHDGASLSTVRLGSVLSSGERLQSVVPTGYWQQARSLGRWTLVGCTVAPGFTFDGLELAAEGFKPSQP